MATWKSASMAGFLPSDLSTLTTTASGVASTVSGFLSVIKSAIGAASIIGLGSVDLASALITAVEKFRADFLGSGFYAANMWDYPLVQYYRSGLSGESFNDSFATDLANSFNDSNDPNAPTFSSSAAMLVLVGGVPGLGPTATAVGSLVTAFTWWPELREVWNRLERIEWSEGVDAVATKLKTGIHIHDVLPSKQTKAFLDLGRLKREALDFLDASDLASIIIPTDVNKKSVDDLMTAIQEKTAASTYPDWQSISVRTVVPPVVDVVDQVFDPLIEGLRTGRDLADTLTSLIESLESKVAQLDAVVTRINVLISQLDALISVTGLYALWIETTLGVTGLVQELANASSPPFDDQDAFYFGIAMVAGGSGLTPFKNLFSPIGI